MPIDLDDWMNIEERELKSNSMLLDWMRSDQAYTTTEVQTFLKIHHPAALQRLKRLEQLGFVEFKTLGKTKYWRKIKDWPRDETVELDYSNPLDSEVQKEYAKENKTTTKSKGSGKTNRKVTA
tara:strand:- start:42951 stop:43319 length:369 start_codon:yes stop_codon:yes gene_type:complete